MTSDLITCFWGWCPHALHVCCSKWRSTWMGLDSSIVCCQCTGRGDAERLPVQAMCRDYYTLEFMDRSVDTSPIAPALAEFFDNVLDRSVSQLNFKVHPHIRGSAFWSHLTSPI